MNKNLLISIVVIILAAGAGYWVWQQDSQVGIVPILSARDQAFLDSIPYAGELPVSDIDTSNWKTYRNEEYGFEVKYPDHTEPVEVCDGGECTTVSEWFSRENFGHGKLITFGNNPSNSYILLEIVNGGPSSAFDRLQLRSASSNPSFELKLLTIDKRLIVSVYRTDIISSTSYLLSFNNDNTLIFSSPASQFALMLEPMLASFRLVK